ncbi:c-type cytochrome [Roseateles violae]|uniref:C-type cytochrome n=1 Tax=Roseateles violae TaxID=3058042 RepID=A0ABT8DQK0_9BURK|nr:c-type cytochrome [Pelomonas sp. PFR6]MDN3920238.1 c-type cytochrome [Pelomonas sp. PFR6]
MKPWIKYSLAGLAGLALLAGAGVAYGLMAADRKMERRVALSVAAVPYTSDAAAIERGRYLFSSRGCVDCHGADGAGRAFIDSPEMRVKGPNISPGPGNVVAAYRPEDWVRAIRHGVKPDGRPLLIMPSEDYNRFTDADLAALVAYVRQLPPAAGTAAELKLPPPVRVLYGLGLIPDAASRIDHARPPQQPVPEGLTLEHGRYVANMCIGCHGERLSGGKIPGGPPDWPAAANLTPGEGTAMTRYPDAKSFAALMRSGKRADGSAVAVMPFGSLGQMSDTDLGALHLYLQSLAPLKAGGR